MNFDYTKLLKNRILVTSERGYFKASRFSEKQLSYFKSIDNFYALESNCTSGVSLEFKSDTTIFSFDFISEETSQCIVNFDIFVNDQFVVSKKYNTVNFKKYYLVFKTDSKGLKKFTIYFPHSSSIKINNFQLEDKASFSYVEDKKKLLLTLGDSITQGYNATNPKDTYAVKLSRKLDMDLINQGLSGYFHDENYLDENLSIKPSIIISAFGTNDWVMINNLYELKVNILSYFKKLHQIYNNIPIFIITPIYRNGYLSVLPLGSFFDVTSTLIKEAQKFDNFFIIDGLDLVPHNPKYFDDNVLHPTNEGFSFYSDNLYEQIVQRLEINKFNQNS